MAGDHRFMASMTVAGIVVWFEVRIEFENVCGIRIRI